MKRTTSLSNEAFTPLSLYKAWPEVRFVSTAAACLRHAKLLQYLQVLASRYPDNIRLEDIGHSFLGRPIQMLTLGSGQKKILLWSQMHGDEPSATPALLDVADYILQRADQPAARAILQNFTLLMIPMLNPDGAEVYQRRNAQGIDINRDALHLATPEGALLKRIRDEHEPMLGFNLHDQDRRKAVGLTGHVANIALLAVSGDAQHTVTSGRLRTKRANAAIVEALTPFIPGGISRYDEDWSPRAFGDNITAWGTPVILIESGGRPKDREVSELTRLNFVAILTVLDGLARDDLAAYDTQVYENLPFNREESWSDVIIKGAYVQQPGTFRAFRADLAFDWLQSDRQAAGCCDDPLVTSQIVLVGDALTHGAGTIIEADGSLLLAPFKVGVRGLSEQQWLNKQNLAMLAGLGVGTIYWAVDANQGDAARVFAGGAIGQGLPHIEIITDAGELPEIVLDGPPSLPVRPVALGAVLQALGAEGPDYAMAMQKMWMPAPGESLESPPLIKDKPASFLVVSPTIEGQIDFAVSRLEAVWLEGQKIADQSAGSG
jgi:hypothetical protein